MMTPRCPVRFRRQPRGFTLIELMVVTLIIVLLSAAMIPVVVPAINERRVSTAANLIHAELNRARDAAVRAGAPRGIRLLPDEFDSSRPLVLTSSRIIAIQPGPSYSEGKVTSVFNANSTIHPDFLAPPYIFIDNRDRQQTMMVKEHKFDTRYDPPIPTEPTSWFWNIRQGDQISFGDSNRRYTIIGPMLVRGENNPQRFINSGPHSPPSEGGYLSLPGSTVAEFLVLVDGKDNDGDGFTDEDDYFPGDVDGERALEQIWEDGPNLENSSNGMPYRIYRRPVPTEDGREVTLPAGTVIDLTTWNAPSAVDKNGNAAPSHPERSQLPVDPDTRYVDIMIAPNGQVLQSVASSNVAPPVDMPYFHFWITDVEDVHNPLWNTPANGTQIGPPIIANEQYSNSKTPLRYLLPMSSDSYSEVYDLAGDLATGRYPTNDPQRPTLRANRRLVSLNTMSGQVITSKAENFSIFNTNRPYQDALGGYGE